MRLNRLSLISLVIALSLVLVACSGTATPTESVDSSNSGDTNTDSSPEDTSTTNEDPANSDSGPMVMSPSLAATARLDPAITQDEGVLAVSSYLYDTLFSDEGEGLALEWSVSGDGLTYEVRLRANAVFSDGTPVDSDVVLNNFNRWFDPLHPLHGDDAQYASWLMYFGGFREAVDFDSEPTSLFDGVEKVDDLNFLIHLFEPIDNLEEILAMPAFSILSPTALEAGGSDYGSQSSGVVGSGPYLIESWDADGLLLSPNPSYWGGAASDQILFPAQ